MSEQANTERIVSEFVQKLVGRKVDPDEPIISSQLLESIAAVKLIAFVEDTLGVAVDDDDIVLANFDSVEAIVALVHAKAGAL